MHLCMSFLSMEPSEESSVTLFIGVRIIFDGFPRIFPHVIKAFFPLFFIQGLIEGIDKFFQKIVIRLDRL